MSKKLDDMGQHETMAMGLLSVVSELHNEEESNFETNLIVARAICDHTGMDFEHMIEFFADEYAQMGDISNHKKAVHFLSIFRSAIQLDTIEEQEKKDDEKED